MASSKANPPPPNLAALLLIKRKMSEKTSGQSNIKQPSQPPAVTGAHSDEKLTYHQNPVVINSQATATTTAADNTSEQPKISRKTKQLEVTLLDKKMEEINRKQEEKTNEALDTWKGFDSLNYGFTSEPGRQNSTPVPSGTKNQRTPTPTPKLGKHPSPTPRASSPKRVTSPVKDHPKPKSPLQREEPQKATSPIPPAHKTIQKQPTPPPSPKQEKIENRRSPSPLSHKEKPIEKQPKPPRQNSIEKSSSPPPPPPRRSRINSAPSAEKTKSPEQEPLKSKSPTPIIENIIPFSSVLSHPQIFEKNIQPFEQSFLPTSTTPHFKLFPDIKHDEMKRLRKAHKSIQRSMDRYRFHIW